MKVAPLDVADEVQAAVIVEQLGGLLDRLVALALLLADGEQRDARILDAENPLCVDGAHVRELVEIVAARVHVRADVEQDERARLRHHLNRQSGAIDPWQSTELENRRRHARPGVARGNQRVGPALLEQVHRDHDRRILLGLQRERRRFVHFHDLAGRDDLHARRNWTAGDLGNAFGDTDEQDGVRRVRSRPRHRAGDYLHGRVVAAHRVNRYSDGTAAKNANRAQVHRIRPAAAAFPA
jgi:hypothetical protein